MPDHPSAPDTPYCLLYDGECPMCSAFAKIVDNTEGNQLKKIDARQDGPIRNQATAAGMDLDYGIVVEHHGQLHYGAEALTFLANRHHQSLTLKLLYLPFRSRRLARLIYPLLVRVRRLLLWIGRKPLIHNLTPGS